MMRILMIVVLLVIVDFFTGYVKAYLKCQLNSSVGLDGLIRKAMILFSMLVFKLLDEMLGFNLLNLLPSEGMLFFCEMGSGERRINGDFRRWCSVARGDLDFRKSS